MTCITHLKLGILFAQLIARGIRYVTHEEDYPTEFILVSIILTTLRSP